MSSTSEQASGSDRDPRQAGASTAYDPYAASYYTAGLTALTRQPACDAAMNLLIRRRRILRILRGIETGLAGSDPRLARGG